MSPPTRDTLRIGCGAGQSDDRIPPAVELAKHGELDYLVFECLAERTIGRETLTKMHDPERGYTPLLHDRLRAVLPTCIDKGIRIVSNMGAANPLAGAKAMRREAQDLGLGDIACAVVRGDDVSDVVRSRPDLTILETGEPLESLLPSLVSANAYLGADVVAQAIGVALDLDTPDESGGSWNELVVEILVVRGPKERRLLRARRVQDVSEGIEAVDPEAGLEESEGQCEAEGQRGQVSERPTRFARTAPGHGPDPTPSPSALPGSSDGPGKRHPL